MTAPQRTIYIPDSFSHALYSAARKKKDMSLVDCRDIVLDVYKQLHELNLEPSSLLVKGGFMYGDDLEFLVSNGFERDQALPVKVPDLCVSSLFPAHQLDFSVLDKPIAGNPLLAVALAIERNRSPAFVFFNKDAFAKYESKQYDGYRLHVPVDTMKCKSAIAAVLSVSHKANSRPFTRTTSPRRAQQLLSF